MKCPHCLVDYHYSCGRGQIGQFTDWIMESSRCPSCMKPIIFVEHGGRKRLVEPKGVARAPLPKEVPPKYAEDYKESCLVLADSRKASAALSRRCLQNILREVGGVKHGDLYDEIEETIQSKSVPTHISDALHAVRTIGNFAAHPIKSKSTGEIVEVESGEAEWNLEVLESLFDFYFVQPARFAEKKAALNKKLQEAGKKPLP
jgi:Domain of unknown function (DUF4145)